MPRLIPGGNLAEINYFNGDRPWINLARAASDWVNYAPSFDAATAISVDADGNLNSLAGGQMVQMMLPHSGTGIPDYNTAGNYLVVRFTGTATVALMANGGPQTIIDSAVEGGVTRIVYSVTWSSGSANNAFCVNTTDAGDPIRNIEIIPQVWEAAYDAGQRFSPTFLARLRAARLKYLRFLNWTATNGSQQVDWADRRSYAWRSQRSRGGWPNSDLYCPLPMVSYEEIFDLCNTLGVDCWVNLPHQATDAYITAFCELALGELDSARKLILEYSNEVWNGIPAFSQNAYAVAQGGILWPAADDTARAIRWTAKRLGDMAGIARGVFTGADASRLLIAGCWQNAASRSNATAFLDFTDAHVPSPVKTVVAAGGFIATAPYLGDDLGRDPQAVAGPPTSPYPVVTMSMTASEGVYWTLNGNRGLGQVVGTWFKGWVDLCNERGLALGTYEGGIGHYNGPGLQGNSALTEQLRSFSNDPSAASAVAAWLRRIKQELGTNPGGRVTYYTINWLGTWSGHWGLWEDTDQAPNPPKARGWRAYFSGRQRRSPPYLLIR